MYREKLDNLRSTDSPTVSAAATAAERASDADGLSLVSVCKRFKGREVLRELSLQVRPKEIVGLLGADGAGKTTCFYSILGLIKPDSGRVVLEGIDITRLPTYRRCALGLAFLPQEPCIFRGLTVAQNIEAILEMTERNRQERAERREQLLAEFHLDHIRDRSAAVLSGGERRRCEIARALAADPEIMLLDEPFAGIDPITIAEIKKLILRLKERGVGVLVTDQDLHDLLEIVERAYVLHEGHVIFHGTPAELLSDPQVRRFYLGEQFEHGSVCPPQSRPKS